MDFEYFEPGSVTEAAALAARYGDGARFIAGGTDLVIQMRRKRVAPAQVIDLQRLAALKDIDVSAGTIRLGALVTHRSIEKHPDFQRALLGLVESARVIGGHQVRNVGTVGGNICNASPAADLLPILLALDADVHLSTAEGARRLPVSQFVRGPGKTDRRSGEILTGVTFAAPSARSATAFIKSGRRRAMEISIVSLAAQLTLDASDRVADVRIAIGAAAPTAIRATAAEAMLRGKQLSPDLLHEAARCAVEASAPLDDVRASAEYRRHLIAVNLPRVVRVCAGRIAEFTHA